LLTPHPFCVYQQARQRRKAAAGVRCVCAL
jgi:hypothetical protein